MSPNTERRVAEPLRALILAQGVYGWFEWTRCNMQSLTVCASAKCDNRASACDPPNHQHIKEVCLDSIWEMNARNG